MTSEEAVELLGMLATLYFLPQFDPGFAVGRRAKLLYAVPSMRASFPKVNRKGPDPKDYLDFARKDLAQRSSSGAINAVANAKRAIHLSIESFLQVYCLQKVVVRKPFPVVLELLSELGAFPVRLVNSLNRRRNLIEHEYEQPSHEEAHDLVEIAELFVTLAYRFFRHAVVGVYVGSKHSEVCREWLLHPARSQVQVFEIASTDMIPTPGGVVHYNVNHEMPRALVETIPLDAEHKHDWLPILDLFVYCTKSEAFQLGNIGGPGVIVPSRVSFECTDNRDEHGRRQFVVRQFTSAPESLVLPERSEDKVLG
jgi:hypothetical protein